MTTVTFHTEGSRISGFSVKGHSGYAPAGEDIVCAAVTSAVRLVECTVNDVMGLRAAVKVQEKAASISLRLPGGLSAVAGLYGDAGLVHKGCRHRAPPEFVEFFF